MATLSTPWFRGASGVQLPAGTVQLKIESQPNSTSQSRQQRLHQANQAEAQRYLKRTYHLERRGLL